MKELLTRLIQHEKLSRQEAKEALLFVGSGAGDPYQITTFLSVFMMRSIAVEELAGFRDALLELCVAVDLSAYNPIDLCGTGGDGKDTFNISTLSSFVTAGAGIHVAKHGNYGVSSSCGSSNVMEHLGIKFSNDADFLEKCIDQAGICVLHAPLFHPAMKHVAPIRRALQLKTFFNMLGPLVNPCSPKRQIVGVFNLGLLRLYSYLFQDTDKQFCILHALDGYDEISLTGATKAVSKHGEMLIRPVDFGLKPLSPKAIGGGNSVADAAAIFTAVLNDKATPAQKQVVCANAGTAIATALDISIAEGYAKAQESIESKKALGAFKKLLELSKA
ncbi:MAG: anthranilate phosphoribosyltransferase [Flavobacteriaceae bacterium]